MSSIQSYLYRMQDQGKLSKRNIYNVIFDDVTGPAGASITGAGGGGGVGATGPTGANSASSVTGPSGS